MADIGEPPYLDYSGANMSRKMAGKRNRLLTNSLVISLLGLALCFGTATVFAQQNQPGEVTATIDRQDSQAQAPPDQAPPDQMPPNQPVPPQTLTLPTGTVIRVRTNQWLS